MKIIIEGVKRQGDKDEYISFKVIAVEVDLKDFLLIDTTFDEDGEVSNKERHIFKFPKQTVTKDQKIFLYTHSQKFKQGALNRAGNIFYSWNLGHDVWNDGGDKAVLIEIADFKAKAV